MRASRGRSRAQKVMRVGIIVVYHIFVGRCSSVGSNHAYGSLGGLVGLNGPKALGANSAGRGCGRRDEGGFETASPTVPRGGSGARRQCLMPSGHGLHPRLYSPVVDTNL